jgi:threonylcarbamoyladenosine tRNA methylthiotransferase MtaB
MRRRYRRELYADRIKLIKKLMPHCAIGVDVIVGFPSESDEDFKDSFDFLQSLDISYLHVFTYSERDNTHALSIKPVVPVNLRHERNKALRHLSYMKMQLFTEEHTGQVRKVLFESNNKNEMMEGYTDNYIRITTPYKAEWVNQIVDWEI